MKRKVSLHGPSTLTISLPSAWAKKYGIKKGHELDIEINGKNLSIKGGSEKKEHKKTRIDIGDLNQRLGQGVLSLLYKKGLDEIEVYYNDPKSSQMIQRAVKNHLLGFIIMEQGKNRCLLKCVSKELKEEFDKSLRRAFLVTLSLAESSLEMIRNNDYDSLNELKALETTNNQLTNFCERLLNRDFNGEEKTTFKYVIVWQLEKIADEYNEILKLIIKNKVKQVSKDIIKLYEETNRILRRFYEIYYKIDLNRLQELFMEKRKIEESVHKNRIKSSLELMMVLHLLRIVSQIIDISPSILVVNGFLEE
jgi:phosphate uptake regulator